MKCINCGNEIPNDSLRCPDCGENLQKGMATAATNAAPGFAGSVLNEKLTYARLGEKREFLTGKGQNLFSLLKIVMVAIPLLLKFFGMIAMLRDGELNGFFETIFYILICGALLAVSLYFRLNHYIRAREAVQAKNYVDAWEFTARTKGLMGAAICWDMIMTALYQGLDNGSGLTGFTIFVDIAAFFGMLYISIYASVAAEKVAEAASSEAEALHAAESGRYVEENDVDPYKGKVLRILLSFGYVFYVFLALFLFFLSDSVLLLIFMTLIFLAGLAAPKVLRTTKIAAWKEKRLWYDRPDEFYKYPEIFITPKLSFEAVIEQIKLCDFTLAKTHWKTSHNGTIEFVGYNGLFKAAFSEVQSPDPNYSKFILNFKNVVRGKGVGFGFRGWLRRKLNQDVKKYEVYMNLGATQIEWAILRIAPNAQITLPR